MYRRYGKACTGEAVADSRAVLGAVAGGEPVDTASAAAEAAYALTGPPVDPGLAFGGKQREG